MTGKFESKDEYVKCILSELLDMKPCLIFLGGFVLSKFSKEDLVTISEYYCRKVLEE